MKRFILTPWTFFAVLGAYYLVFVVMVLRGQGQRDEFDQTFKQLDRLEKVVEVKKEPPPNPHHPRRQRTVRG